MPRANGLIAELKQLQTRVAQLGKARDKAIARVNELIHQFEINAAELAFSGRGAKRRSARTSASGGRKPTRPRKVGAAKSNARKAAKVAAKYRGPDGATSSGRGRPPGWLKDAIANGKAKEDFLIGRRR